uniref:Senescence domain-containing protein n=1 Tax=Meloidogyne hapla TaxID=6305 RepID=A0A1I8BUU5_MELHA
MYGIVIGNKTVSAIAKQIGAVYSTKYQQFLIRCNKAYSPIILSIGGVNYELTKSEKTSKTTSSPNTAQEIVDKTEKAVKSGANDLSKAVDKGIDKTQKAAKSIAKMTSFGTQCPHYLKNVWSKAAILSPPTDSYTIFTDPLII